MAIIKKFNPNQIYLSKKLEDRLKTIFDYPLSIIEAPTGYGKTTAVKEYLKKLGKPYIWFNVDSDSKEKTFEDFCVKIRTISEAAAHSLQSSGYPHDNMTVKQMVSAINSISYIEETVFVVDNYQLVADKYLDEVIRDLAGSASKNVRIVIITQAINSNGALELIMSRRINYISKADFELDKSDILQYYKISGIKLEDEEAEFLYKYTEGWISALYLQMLSYTTTNTFEMTVDIENLIGKAIWYHLDRNAQDFLIGIGVFNSFTLRQCIYIAEGSLTEKEIENILNTSGFIRYDSKEGKYFMHSILKYFLEGEFEKMEKIFKKDIIRKAGNWYRDNEDYSDAIEYYYKNRDYESILSMNFGADALNNLHLNRANKGMFIDVTTNTPKEMKNRYLHTYILFVFFLFLDNEREYYDRECQLVHELIEEEYKDSYEYEELLGEYYVLQCFNMFNDLKAMKENLKKAYELLKKPSRILDTRTSFLFSCPSPYSLYHSSCGVMEDESQNLNDIMPIYYRLTDGKSKGVEALFKAEALLLKGEISDAMKLCEKALYMSQSREQSDVYVGALMCVSRIAYLRGDTEMLKNTMNKVKEFSENSESMEIFLLCDLCIGFINVAINSIEKMPVWLTDYVVIEKNTVITSLGFANIVYGKYLLMKESYSQFLSISGQMLSIAGIYNNVMYRLYTLIYIAIAKNQTGDRVKAVSMLKEAMELAKADEMYIPFVENFNYINSLFNEIEKDAEFSPFLKKINELAKKYIRGLQSSERVTSRDQRYGLTKREMEVAKLAAQRLSNKEIADQLFIAESTVKSNLKVIFNKLGINSRNDLKNFV